MVSDFARGDEVWLRVLSNRCRSVDGVLVSSWRSSGVMNVIPSNRVLGRQSYGAYGKSTPDTDVHWQVLPTCISQARVQVLLMLLSFHAASMLLG